MADDADAQLLLGLLSLSNGLISREQFSAALRVWLQDRSRRFVDILIELGAISKDDRMLLSSLTELHLQKHDGDSTKSLAAVGSLISSLDELGKLGDESWAATIAMVGRGRAASESSDARAAENTDEALAETVSLAADGRQGSTEDRSHPQGKTSAAGRRFGDYELLHEIARGGMGVVYQARQISLGRIVALKMILAGQLADAEDVRRFRTEARAAAALDHPGIVPIFETGEHQGQHFFAMGFVEGQSLADELRDGPMPARRAAEITRKVAEAIGYAHSRGVIHRDLKPGNVLLDQADEPKVTDFGLAKRMDIDSQLTGTGQIMGTPAFMPPEQALGRVTEVREPADVYSLGAMLYCLLTRRPPFQAANPVDTLRQVLETEPLPLRKLDPSLPKDLETICLKCLRKQAGQRYSSAQELADDLRRWLDGEPIQARPVSRAEKAWLWCKRKPVIAGLTAAIVIGAVIGSAVFWERQNAARAAGLVESLAKAEPSQVPAIIADLDGVRWWAQPRLRKQLVIEGSSLASRRLRLHARLALAADDPALADDLVDDLLAADYRDVANVRDALGRNPSSRVERLWAVFHGTTDDLQPTPAQRFRAGLSLAGLDPQGDQWTADDHRFLVDQLVVTNPVYQPVLWDLLAPLPSSLLDPLEAAFNDSQQGESVHVAAANAITFFAGGDGPRLARLLTIAHVAQYDILFDKYRLVSDETTRADLLRIVSKQPTVDLDLPQRIALGKQRAAAAITLLRLGERESILPVLRYDDDPEALTQFVDGCFYRGVTAAELIELLEWVDERRGPLEGERQKIDGKAMYAILLALGMFGWEALPAKREQLVARLEQIYALDPSSGVHSATGWLLRRWGQHNWVAQVDQRPLPYDPSGQREWYVQAIECETEGFDGVPQRKTTLHFTFIVFAPGEFTMGRSDHEPNPYNDETRHQVTLSRTLAVCDQEVAWAQWDAYKGEVRRRQFEQQRSRVLLPDDPAFAMNWFEAVSFCRWLSQQTGVSEVEQSYADPATMAIDGEGNPTSWPLSLERAGFRLPTEAEWEYVCRSGVRTAYSFGSDRQQLDWYAWNRNNSGGLSRVRRVLRPNPRGLFDIHGNLSEWCHDWQVPELEGMSDPLGAPSGRFRVLRGGCWDFTWVGCRSAVRHRCEPSIRNDSQGFRLAVSPDAASSPTKPRPAMP